MSMKVPNLFIVGAPKSGTTLLYDLLGASNEFYFPKIKELNHFSHQELDDIGMYYKDYRLIEREPYMKMFSEGKAKYYIDSSVSYFAFENIPQKLFQFNPESEIIIILRNPIDRAFSHFVMDQRMGHANREFLYYIQSPNNSPAHYHQYVSNSLYYKNIKRYVDVFGSNKVHIIVLEKITEDLPKVLESLGVQIEPNQLDFAKRSNEHKESRNWIGRYTMRNREIVSRLKLVLPKGLISKVKNYIYKPARKIEIDLKSYALLKEILENDMNNLNDLLNRDLNKIWNV